ncbi:hypothetical protein ACN28S_64650 [Cystobacter fuscus]
MEQQPAAPKMIQGTAADSSSSGASVSPCTERNTSAGSATLIT